MYHHFNTTLRHSGMVAEEIASGKRAKESTPASAFATTIHLAASAMTKLSRLQPVQSLYRGLGGGKRRLRLPDKCALVAATPIKCVVT